MNRFCLLIGITEIPTFEMFTDSKVINPCRTVDPTSMTMVLLISSFILIYLAVTVGLVHWAETFEEFGRGKFVLCPETGKQATIRISTAMAVVSSLLLKRRLAIRACTFWPFSRNCERKCLGQIER